MVFSEESPMSVALTTTHENGIFRGIPHECGTHHDP
jgi:hypothetical protein